MGTSTASNSEATINTSTDSASTLVTNVTSNTDTDATNDSLDLGEHSCSGQSEPLLSSLDEPASNSISSLISPRMLKSRASDQESLIESPCTVYYQKRPLKHHHQASSSISDDDDLIEINGLEDNYPRTAPAPSTTNNQQSRFPFDERSANPPQPASVRGFEKTQSKFTFEESSALRRSSGKFVESSSSSSSSPSSVSANTVTIVSPCKGDESRNHPRFTSPTGNSGGCGGLNRVVFRDKISSKKRINSAPLVTSSASTGNAKLMDNTMFPFDREAIDYERIQRECFAVEETEEAVRHYPFLDLDTDPDSPVYDKPSSIFQSPSKSPYRRSQVNASNSSVHESNEMTERYLYQSSPQGHGNNGNNGSDDIFRQYAILSQQEKNKSHDRDRDRRSPNTKRAKGSKDRRTDAFSPKPIKARHSPAEQEESFICGTVSPSSSTGGCPSVLKFDQINSKFEQIPPNQKRTSNCFSSNGNIHKSANALSPTVGHHYHHYVGDPNYSPTIVRVTPPLPDLRVDYFNSQQESDDGEQGNDEGEFEDIGGENGRRSSNLSRTKRKSPDRGYSKGGGSHHSHSQYHQAVMMNSSEDVGGSSSEDPKQSRGGAGGESGLDECQKNAQQLKSINVTPNPMDGPVCTQPPRATIVVQQVNYHFYLFAIFRVLSTFDFDFVKRF